MLHDSHRNHNISEPLIADKDLYFISSYARENFGIHMPPQKHPLLRARLTKRLRSLNIYHFDQYKDRVKKDIDGERNILLSVLTTNITHFFRESHHFDTLKYNIMPSIGSKAKKGQCVRFWSAGCSTGQEAYSIAISIAEMLPNASKYDIRVDATDIDQAVLDYARLGEFQEHEVKNIPPALMKYFEITRKNSMNFYQVCKNIKKIVEFRELNLARQLKVSEKYDAIFCRNVAIYFDHAIQSELWHKLTSTLKEGGHLFVGHSERVGGRALKSLAPAGITTYRRMGANTSEST